MSSLSGLFFHSVVEKGPMPLGPLVTSGQAQLAPEFSRVFPGDCWGPGLPGVGPVGLANLLSFPFHFFWISALLGWNHSPSPPHPHL